MVEKKEGEKGQRRSLTKLELRIHACTHTNTRTHITYPTHTPFLRVSTLFTEDVFNLWHISLEALGIVVVEGGGVGGHTSLSYAQEWKHKQLVQTRHQN